MTFENGDLADPERVHLGRETERPCFRNGLRESWKRPGLVPAIGCWMLPVGLGF